MVRESRIIATLLLKKTTKDQWTKAITDDNLLQKRTPASAIRMAGAIRRRLEGLESDFLKMLCEADNQLATQIVLVAAIEKNLLLLEFMESVVKDAYAANKGQLHSYEWTDFLESCANKDPEILHWKESSKKKMGQVAIRMLKEAGYIERTRVFKLQPVIIHPELIELLQATNRQRILDAMDIS